MFRHNFLLLLLAAVLCGWFSNEAAQAQPTKSAADTLKQAKIDEAAATKEADGDAAEVVRLEGELKKAKAKAALSAPKKAEAIAATKKAEIAAKDEKVAKLKVERAELKDPFEKATKALAALKAKKKEEVKAEELKLAEDQLAGIVAAKKELETEILKLEPTTVFESWEVVVAPAKAPEKKAEPKLTEFVAEPVVGAKYYVKKADSWVLWTWEQKTTTVEPGPSGWVQKTTSKTVAHVASGTGQDQAERILDGRYYAAGRYHWCDGKLFKYFKGGDTTWEAGWYEEAGEEESKAPKGTQVYHSVRTSVPAASSTTQAVVCTTCPQDVTGSYGGTATNCVPCGQTATFGGSMGYAPVSSYTPTHTFGGSLQGGFHPVRNAVQHIREVRGHSGAACQPGMPCWNGGVSAGTYCQPGMPCWGN